MPLKTRQKTIFFPYIRFFVTLFKAAPVITTDATGSKLIFNI